MSEFCLDFVKNVSGEFLLVVFELQYFLKSNMWSSSVQLYSSMNDYFLAIIFWYSTRMRYPRHSAWVDFTTWAKRSSLISSKVPSRPALKNTWNHRQVKYFSLVHIKSYHLQYLSTISTSVQKQMKTLVCPNLYCVWSTSMEPSSFSAAFLLSINCPSGTALALRILYL